MAPASGAITLQERWHGTCSWAVALATHMHDAAFALFGGLLIGTAASILLLSHGRIAGVSGILAGLLFVRDADTRCRAGFVGGLLLVGLALAVLEPAAVVAPHASLAIVAVAGVLVGFGSRLGNGCTSGHAVCGVSRLSPRSLVATATFLGTGMLTVAAVRLLGGAS